MCRATRMGGMDLGLFHAINSLAGQAGWSDRLLTWAAGYLPIALVVLVAGGWFWPGSREERGQRQRLVVYAVVAALIGLGLAQGIGHVWFRERPYVHHAAHLLLAPSPDPSFPSDHAVGGFALATPFALARRRLGWVLLGLATLLCVARVAAGTHYPSDVLAGALLGTGVGLLVWRCRAWVERPLAWTLTIARRWRLA